MKLIRKIITCLFVFSLLFLSSCSAETTYTIKEMDGKYYLNFPDGNEPIGETISSIGPNIEFESIADMKQTFLGKEEVDFYKKAALCSYFPQTEGKGIHFFNMERLLVPVLPQGFSEQPSRVHIERVEWGIYYGIHHAMENNENITTKVAFYHSMKVWNLHMEHTVENHLAMLGEDKQISYEREKGVTSIAVDDGSSRFKYRICTDSDSKRYVIELVKDGHRSVAMFVLEGETFFSVQISGLTESPSVEYLQSFSAKVYED